MRDNHGQRNHPRDKASLIVTHAIVALKQSHTSKEVWFMDKNQQEAVAIWIHAWSRLQSLSESSRTGLSCSNKSETKAAGLTIGYL